MEARELRRLRQAHGLTVSELASMIKVPAEDVSRWEATPDGATGAPIDRAARHQILRELALYRDRLEMQRLPDRPRAVPAGFVAGSLVPVLARVR